jgi:hypothetical protein
MRFTPDAHAVSPLDEWMARTGSVFLAADDPHQECHRRARAQGVHDVNLVCDCPKPPPCQKECCR